MATVGNEKFLQIYGSLLVDTWGDEALKQRFKSNPSNVLKEYGLDPGKASVELISPMDQPTRDCTPESAVQLWNDGLKSGKIQFVYPESIPEGAAGMELSADQLDAIAGGGTNACCCCTPCCSCC